MRARHSLIALAAAGALGLPAAAAGAPPWSVPVDLSTPGSVAPSDPSVAVSPEGRAVIAWGRRDTSLVPKPNVVQVRTRATWGAPFVGPRTLFASAGSWLPREPDASAAAGGIALVGWIEGGGAVALRVLPRTGRAVTATRLFEGARAQLDGLAVGIAPSGAAVAVWTRDPFPVETTGGDRVVRVAVRSAATGTWGVAGDLSAPGAHHPAVAVAPDGSSIVAWERGRAIEASIGSAAEAFAAPVALSAAGARARFPAVAMNAAGDAVVAWPQDAVTVAVRTAGGPFSAPRAISAAGGLPDAFNLGAPDVAVTDGGRAIATWRRVIGGRYRTEAAVRPAAGLDWDAAAILSPAVPRNVGRPSLGASAAGHAVVAWSQPFGITLAAIRARALSKAGTAFGALESVSARSGRGSAPSVGLDSKGRAVLAWREDPVGGPGRFFRTAIRFSPG